MSNATPRLDSLASAPIKTEVIAQVNLRAKSPSSPSTPVWADPRANASGSDTLADSFGRRFSYLRLSVTDACNFKCQYCLPNGYQAPARVTANSLGRDANFEGQDAKRDVVHEGFLSLNEIRQLIEGFAEVGTKKIRLTGGEPTLRRDILEIVRLASSTAGIEKVAISTNGWNLARLARPLRQAGVTALNISADSLDRARFASTSGVDRLEDVLQGINVSLNENFEAIKINAVLMRESFEAELDRFLAFVKIRPVSVRFIELMATLENRKLFESQHLRSEFLRQRLLETGWTIRARGRDDGPAVEFTHPKYLGRIGLIAPYGHDFCESCNRLRVTSRGAVRLCLFGDGNHSVRHLLQREEDRAKLQSELWKLVGVKKISHELLEGQVGDNRGFSAMGG